MGTSNKSTHFHSSHHSENYATSPSLKINKFINKKQKILLTHFPLVDIFLPQTNMNLFASFIILFSETIPHIIFPLPFIFSSIKVDINSFSFSLVIFKLSIISFLCSWIEWIRSVELHISFTILFSVFPAALILTQIRLNEFTFSISLSLSPLSFV